MAPLETLFARPMQRVAVVATAEDARSVLVALAETAMVELDEYRAEGRAVAGPATLAIEGRRAKRPGPPSVPAAGDAPVPATGEAADEGEGDSAGGSGGESGPVLLGRRPPDVAELVRAGRVGELRGEAEVERVRAAMIEKGPVVAIAGWCPTQAVGEV